MNYGWEITKIVFYLVLVLGIIYLVTYVVKRFLFKVKNGNHMKIVDRLYVAPKKYLSLIRVMDKMILISVSEKKIEKLGEWDEDEVDDIDDIDDLDKSGDSGEDFNEYIQQFLRVSRRDKDD